MMHDRSPGANKERVGTSDILRKALALSPRNWLSYYVVLWYKLS